MKQSDLLATTRNDVVDDDDDDDNDDDGWMGHQVKFVRHFEDSLRDGSFEPSVDLYVTEDPLKQDPSAARQVQEKMEMRKRKPVRSGKR